MDDRSVPAWVDTLGDLADELQHQRNTQSTLATIVTGAVDMIPGAQWAGVSVITEGRVEVEAATDPLATKLDQLQSSFGGGPSSGRPLRTSARVARCGFDCSPRSTVWQGSPSTAPNPTHSAPIYQRPRRTAPRIHRRGHSTCR